MNHLTTVQCPQCHKVYITTITLMQTVAGTRPTLKWPKEVCDGSRQSVDGGSFECGFEFTTLPVESFDIPIKVAPSNLIVPGGK